MERFRAGAVQLDIASDEPAENLRRALELLEASPRADLFLLPELFTTGYRLDRAVELARSGEAALGVLAGWARERETAVAGSILLPFDGGAANAGFFIDRDGALLPFYRKTHLFSPMGEDKHLKSGRETVVWETSFGPVSMAICYDLRFPGMIRKLAQKGAKLLLVPAEWPDPRIRHWQVLTEARAIENGIWVIGANRAGATGGLAFPGRSRIVDPWGEVIAEGDEREGVFQAEIEMSRVEEARRRIDAVADTVEGID